MKILVTGASGFIGSHLCEKLKELNHDVIGIDAYTSYYDIQLKLENTKILKSCGISIHNIDLSCDDIKPYLDDIDFIFHLAAQPGISNTPYEFYLKHNVTSTHRLIDALPHNSNLKGFINISTSSVYGYNATKNEEECPKPTSFYGVSKLYAEQLVMSYQREKQFPACSLRLYSVVGPRERPEKLYPKLIKAILKGDKFKLYKDSENHVRSFTYVGDIIDGLIQCLNNFDKCNGEIFNLGTDITNTTGEGIKIIEEILGSKADIEIIDRRKGDQLNTKANIDKAKKYFNYNPKTSLIDALKKEVEWFKRIYS